MEAVDKRALGLDVQDGVAAMAVSFGHYKPSYVSGAGAATCAAAGLLLAVLIVVLDQGRWEVDLYEADACSAILIFDGHDALVRRRA